MSRITVNLWTPETEREIGMARPCECGCDSREGYKGVGYLTATGISVWVHSEIGYQALKEWVGEFAD